MFPTKCTNALVHFYHELLSDHFSFQSGRRIRSPITRVKKDRNKSIKPSAFPQRALSRDHLCIGLNNPRGFFFLFVFFQGS